MRRPQNWKDISRSLRGNVDRNADVQMVIFDEFCRSLRGNVDRNVYVVRRPQNWKDVVPYVGTWIEMIGISFCVLYIEVVPYVGTWIEISEALSHFYTWSKSFPTWERG